MGLWGYWPCLGANLTKMSSRWDSGGCWLCLGANLSEMPSRWDSGDVGFVSGQIYLKCRPDGTLGFSVGFPK